MHILYIVDIDFQHHFSKLSRLQFYSSQNLFFLL